MGRPAAQWRWRASHAQRHCSCCKFWQMKYTQGATATFREPIEHWVCQSCCSENRSEVRKASPQQSQGRRFYKQAMCRLDCLLTCRAGQDIFTWKHWNNVIVRSYCLKLGKGVMRTFTFDVLSALCWWFLFPFVEILTTWGQPLVTRQHMHPMLSSLQCHQRLFDPDH